MLFKYIQKTPYFHSPYYSQEFSALSAFRYLLSAGGDTHHPLPAAQENTEAQRDHVTQPRSHSMLPVLEHFSETPSCGSNTRSGGVGQGLCVFLLLCGLKGPLVAGTLMK